MVHVIDRAPNKPESDSTGGLYYLGVDKRAGAVQRGTAGEERGLEIVSSVARIAART